RHRKPNQPQQHQGVKRRFKLLNVVHLDLRCLRRVCFSTPTVYFIGNCSNGIQSTKFNSELNLNHLRDCSLVAEIMIQLLLVSSAKLCSCSCGVNKIGVVPECNNFCP